MVENRFKKLTEADLQSYTNNSSFSNGRSYYHNGQVFETTLREATLKALCQGSDSEPYSVKATLVPLEEKGSQKLSEYACSCPRGGFCKHIVALLFNWINKPQDFVIRPSIDSLLKNKSREDLLFLIKEILERKPEVENLVDLLAELPNPGSKSAEHTVQTKIPTLDAASIRRQVVSIFHRAGNQWGAAGNVATELESLSSAADRYAQAGQWANAQIIYATVAEEAVAHYEEVQDDGDLYGAINEGVVGLVHCLDRQAGVPPAEKMDKGEREQLIRLIYDLWKFDGNYGDFEENLDEIITGNVTEDEAKMVEAWLREDIKPGDNWRKDSMVKFLVMLKEVGGAGEADLLEEYRQAGLYRELVEKLLELKRPEEALEIALEKLGDRLDVIWFAGQLLKAGGKWIEQAITLVETRLEQAGQIRQPDHTVQRTLESYWRWLGEQYATQGKVQQAFEIERAFFEARPDETTYQAVKTAAQLSGQPKALWEQQRPILIKALEQRLNWQALISIYLSEKKIEESLIALKELERDRGNFGYWAGSPSDSYQVRVAKAAEGTHPGEAIQIYQKVIAKLIEVRGRDTYKMAAGYLAQVKRLYNKQQREKEWEAYITEIRHNHKSLRALKEELDNLRL